MPGINTFSFKITVTDPGCLNCVYCFSMNGYFGINFPSNFLIPPPTYQILGQNLKLFLDAFLNVNVSTNPDYNAIIGGRYNQAFILAAGSIKGSAVSLIKTTTLNQSFSLDNLIIANNLEITQTNTTTNAVYFGGSTPQTFNYAILNTSGVTTNRIEIDFAPVYNQLDNNTATTTLKIVTLGGPTVTLPIKIEFFMGFGCRYDTETIEKNQHSIESFSLKIINNPSCIYALDVHLKSPVIVPSIVNSGTPFKLSNPQINDLIGALSKTFSVGINDTTFTQGVSDASLLPSINLRLVRGSPDCLPALGGFSPFVLDRILKTVRVGNSTIYNNNVISFIFNPSSGNITNYITIAPWKNFASDGTAKLFVRMGTFTGAEVTPSIQEVETYIGYVGFGEIEELLNSDFFALQTLVSSGQSDVLSRFSDLKTLLGQSNSSDLINKISDLKSLVASDFDALSHQVDAETSDIDFDINALSQTVQANFIAEMSDTDVEFSSLRSDLINTDLFIWSDLKQSLTNIGTNTGSDRANSDIIIQLVEMNTILTSNLNSLNTKIIQQNSIIQTSQTAATTGAAIAAGAGILGLGLLVALLIKP